MTTEELIAKLGIADDKKKEAADAVKEFLDGAYVPKSRFNEVNEEKNGLKASLSERGKQLESLKKSAGDSEELKKQIKELQDKNKAAAAEFEDRMKNMRLDTAIQLAVSKDAQDADIVAKLIDRSKLILGEDGKVAGLEEQVKALRESKGFLFKQGQPAGYAPKGGGSPQRNPFAKDTFNMTEQGKLLRENPEQARALAAAAGITI